MMKRRFHISYLLCKIGCVFIQEKENILIRSIQESTEQTTVTLEIISTHEFFNITSKFQEPSVHTMIMDA